MSIKNAAASTARRLSLWRKAITDTSLSKREDWIRYLNQNLKKNMIYYRIDLFISNMEECGMINICDIISSGCVFA
jgi:hypothetical protein